MPLPNSTPHNSTRSTLSDYQRAILQAMNIPMYAMRDGFELPQEQNVDTKLTSEPNFPTKSDALQGDVTSSSPQRGIDNNRASENRASENSVSENRASEHIACENMASENIATLPEVLKLIDETDTFIIQVLAFFDANSIAELDITWQVHDADTIVFANKVLSTPDPKSLTSAILKKQLWQCMQALFKGDKWS